MSRRFLLSFVVLCAGTYAGVAGQPAPPAEPVAALRWFKGNTHTHTVNSDGDSTPDEVVRWYRENRYNFLVLTDHNFLTDVTALNAVHGADEKFLVIKGEELTSRHDGKPLHINGLDVSRRVEPVSGSSVADTLQKNVDGIRAADGVPHVNHPNFGWGITPGELAAVRNNRLFEVYNGHPRVNNLGGNTHPGIEEVWDLLLARGIELYGIAVDDAHHFKRLGDLSSSRPGMGWVMVRAARLEAREILAAMERGDFYASTGVELSDYRVADGTITVSINPIPTSGYRIRFIGKGGTVLEETEGPTATYRITGTEGYVRAKVIESNGKQAWMQPVMVSR